MIDKKARKRFGYSAIFTIVLLFTLILTFSPIQFGYGGGECVSGGEGTSGSPRNICSCTDLQNMSASVSLHYTLGRDIDCSETVGWNSGAGFLPVGTSLGSFSGSFDGQGYRISNLYINRPTQNNIGLFGVTVLATITNFSLLNSEIYGNNSVGSLIGDSMDSSIDLVFSYGEVIGNERVGGLIGVVRAVNISKSSFRGSVIGDFRVGGLVGLIQFGGLINNTHTWGSVFGESSVGGLVGHTQGSPSPNSFVNFSYSASSVTGNTDVGGLIGSKTTNTHIANSFYDSIISGQDDEGKGIPKTTSQMMNIATYADLANPWSIVLIENHNDEVWVINNGSSYPMLSNELNYLYSTLNLDKSLVRLEDGSITITWEVFDNSNLADSVILNVTSPSGELIYESFEESGSIILNSNNMTEIGSYFVRLWYNDTNQVEYTSSNSFVVYKSEISTCHDLLGIKYNLSDHYNLLNDIDCSETTTWNSGLGFLPIGNSSNPFTGFFNGSEHSISNLYINRSNTDYVGMFGYVGAQGSIRELGLENVGIQGRHFVGSISGYSAGNVDFVYSTGRVFGNTSVGGFIGLSASRIYNSYSWVNVSGQEILGGFIGNNTGLINFSYSKGLVSGSSSVGGFIGNNSGLVHNSFWDRDTSQQLSSQGGTSKTTSQMKNISTYSLLSTPGLDYPWDISLIENHTNEVWGIVNGQGYPKLWFYTFSDWKVYPSISNVSVVPIPNTQENVGRIKINWTFNSNGNQDPTNASNYEYFRIYRNNSLLSVPNSAIANKEYIDSDNIIAGNSYSYHIEYKYINNESHRFPTNTSEYITVLSQLKPIMDSISISVNRVTDIINVIVNVTDLRTSISASIDVKSPIYLGPNDFSCAYLGNSRHKCETNFNYSGNPSSVQYQDTIEIEAHVYPSSEGYNSSFKVIDTANFTVPNAQPVVDFVEAYNLTYIEGEKNKTKLICNYTYYDKDTTHEDSIVEYKWYLNNEGLTNFWEVFGETDSELYSPIFDNGDKIKCGVRVNDGTSESNNWSIWAESPVYHFTENINPLLANISDSTSFESPVQIGQEVIFTSIVYDSDETSELKTVFCRDEYGDSGNYSNNNTMTVGSGRDAEQLWFFKESYSLPLEEIRITIGDVFNSTNHSTTHSYPIYDIYVYEVDNYGDIPTVGTTPISRDEDNFFVANKTNRFIFDNAYTIKNYYAIKICINSNNDEGANCDADEGDYFKISIEDTPNENQYGIAKNITGPSSFNFTTNSVRFFSGLSNLGECGIKTLCVADYEVIEGFDGLAEMSCSYTTKEEDNYNQTYSAFVIDSSDARSRIKVGNFYLNKMPQLVSDPVILRIDGEDLVTTNGTVNTTSSLYCNFTTDENVGFDEWKAVEQNYTITWWYKNIGGDWRSCDNQNICPSGTGKELSYVITSPGDKWMCEVTPRDNFLIGSPQNSTAISILEDGDIFEDSNSAPNIIKLDTRNQLSFVVPTQSVVFDLRFRDTDSNSFSVFICEGNSTEAEKSFSLSGCLQKEIFRDILIDGNYGLNDYSFNLIIPENAPLGLYNFTLFVTDGINYGKRQYELDVKRQINISYVRVVNNSNFENFTDNFARPSDNLLCNFNYTDEQGEEITHLNYSSVQDKLGINWFRNTSINEFELVFQDLTVISNNNLNDDERWFCQIYFKNNEILSPINSSNRILIKQNLETSSTAPEITHFYVDSPNAVINQGESFVFRINWFDLDGDPIYAYVCDSNETSPTGCLGKTIAHTNDFTHLNLSISHTINEEQPSNDFTAYAFICDDSYSCSEPANYSFSFNNEPIAENVTVEKTLSNYSCNYDYHKNQPLFGDGNNESATKYVWIVSLNGVESIVKQGIGPDYKTIVPNQQGILFCKVQLQDNRGLKSSEVISSNFRRIETIYTDYEIHVLNYSDFSNKDWVLIRGYYSGEGNVSGKNITAYVFKDNLLDPSPTNNTNSTINYDNPSLFNTTILNISKSNNDTLIYINQSISQTEFNNKYVGFQREGINLDRENFTYYIATALSTSEYTILNISETLHTNITIGDIIHSYDNPQKRGYFEINVTNLSESKLNYVKLFSQHNAELYLNPILSDRTPPKINHSTLSGDFNLNKNDEIITITLYDENSVVPNNTRIEIKKGDRIDYVNFSDNWNFTQGGNLSLISSINHEWIGKEVITLSLNNLVDPGNYTLNITTKDLAGNMIENVSNYLFNLITPEFNQISIKDNLTEESNALRSGYLNVSWGVTAEDFVDYYSVLLYKKVGQNTVLLQSNYTNNTSKVFEVNNLDASACYFARVKYFSLWGMVSDTIVQTNCLPYIITEPSLSDILIKDALFPDEEQLSSNRIKVSFSKGDLINKIINNTTIKLYEDNTIIETINLDLSDTEHVFILFDGENQLDPNNKCYKAEIITTSHAGLSWSHMTDCITYTINNELKLSVISNNLYTDDEIFGSDILNYDGIMIFNDNVVFTINTNEAQNVSYSITGANQSVVVNGTDTFSAIDFRSFSKSINLNVSNTNIDPDDTYFLKVDASPKEVFAENKEKSYIVIFDQNAPLINSWTVEEEIYNNDSIPVELFANETYGIKNAWVVSNKTGVNVTEYLELIYINNSYTINNPYTYYFSKNLSTEGVNSGTTFNYEFYVEDYAGNINKTTSLINTTVRNRAPINLTNLPLIYWNANSFYAEISLFNYFLDPDGDEIKFGINYDTSTNAALSILEKGGNLYGNFRRNVNLEELNVTINVTDSNEDSLELNITIKPVLNGCSDYKNIPNTVFVGFNEDCTPSTPPSPPPPPPSSPGGSSPGVSRPSGSSGGSTPPVIRNDYYFRQLNGINNEIITISPNKDEISLSKLTFLYLGTSVSATFEVRNYLSLPRTIPSPGVEYSIFEINYKGLVPQNIRDIVMEIRVRKNNNKGIKENNVVIYRWNNNKWDAFDLTYTGSDSTYYYYTVKIPGFSYWVVSAKTVELPTQPEVPTQPERPRLPEEQTPKPVETESSVLYTILYGFLILIGISLVVGGVLIAKNKKNGSPQEVVTQPNVEINPLPEYIKRHLDKGISRDEIRAVLVDAGWSKKNIDDAFMSIDEKHTKIDLSSVDINVIKHIEALERQGNSKKEIREELLLRRIPEDIVHASMDYAQAIKNIKIQIKVWVRAGYTIPEIRNHLIGMKWPTTVIYDLLKIYRKK